MLEEALETIYSKLPISMGTEWVSAQDGMNHKVRDSYRWKWAFSIFSKHGKQR